MKPKNSPHCIALLVVLTLAALPLSAQITNNNAATLRVGLVKSFPGRTVSVPVTLTHTGSVSSAQLDLDYAGARMSAGAYQASGLSNNIVLRSRQLGPGRQRVLIYTTDLARLATNQSLGALPFTLAPRDFSAGGPVALTNALASRTNATAATPLGTASGGVSVSPVFVGEDGVVDLALLVLSNLTYVVQATTNFVNWVNVATNFAESDLLIATDTTAAGLPFRYYRGVSMPVGASIRVAGEPPAHVQLSAGRLQAGDKFVFDYGTIPGRTYVVQVSTNLVTWSDAVTNVALASLLSHTNIVTPSRSVEFFRVLELR